VRKIFQIPICFILLAFITQSCSDISVSYSIDTKGNVKITHIGGIPVGGIPVSTTDRLAVPNDTVRFEQVSQEEKDFPPTSFPIYNCGGQSNVMQEVSYSYTHEVIDETRAKFGVEIPVAKWLSIVAEIEKRYGITDKETTTYSTTLIVPAGQNIRYTVIRKQTWESGIAIKNSNGIETKAAYRVLKSESIEVANSELLSCP
jgi:hypothetical protein